MNYLFYFGHPAQYLFLRETIKKIANQKNKYFVVVIKTKDVLESLLKEDNVHYINIQKTERKNNKFSIFSGLAIRTIKLFNIAIKSKTNVLIGTDATIAIVGFFLKKLRITIVEDDYHVIKNLARITYPFTNYILCPNECGVGKWERKKIPYSGFMKLAYLHPKVFFPDIKIVSKYGINNKYSIIRLSKLVAHHDFGIGGINNELLFQLIQILENKNIEVFISSERVLPQNFDKYLLKINPSHMHHVLNYSELLICDSQSMTVEAAMLGVPSIRISDFVNEISVLNILEKKYGLTYGIKPIDENEILNCLNKLLFINDLKSKHIIKRNKMLDENINVSEFLIWLFQDPKNRLQDLKLNPTFQLNFIANK
jgi:predicted glycosyltransferase